MTTTKTWFRVQTRVPHCAEPFVDWYEATTEAEALTLAKADAAEFCLPDTCSFSVRAATEGEARRISE